MQHLAIEKKAFIGVVIIKMQQFRGRPHHVFDGALLFFLKVWSGVYVRVGCV